jgi:type I restriction enzyme S subunit
MSEWKEYALSDLIEIKYGKDHKHLADGKFPLYGSGGIMRFVEKSIYNKESILIPRKGTLSNLFYVNEPFWSVDTMFWSKINQELVIAKYLYYTLKTHNLADLNVGSAVPSLTTEILNKVLVSIPGLDIQKNIAEILSSLDEKIELNNKINQELESLAQLLFKRWFVDFEFPNENGEPYKSLGGEMVDSELGEIPSLFTISNIKDFGEVICGKTPAKSNQEYYGDDIPFVKIPDMHKNVFVTKTEDSLSFKGANSQKNKTLEAGTVILSSIATVGLVSIISRKSQTNQQINAIVPIKSHSTNFLYLLLKSKNEDFQQLASGGSTTLNMNTSTFKSYKVINPGEIVLLKFNDIIDCLFKEIYNNIEESHCLMKMRDTLLPKLISGELQINDN